jgi:hypothetical protein
MTEEKVDITKAKNTFFRVVRPSGFWQKAYSYHKKGQTHGSLGSCGRTRYAPVRCQGMVRK